jgi:hypothetical protein
VDFGAIVADSWKAMRRNPALWGLAGVSALQVALYALIVGGVVAPMAVLSQAMIGLRASQVDGANTDSAVQLSTLVTESGRWIGGHWALLVGVTAAAMALWATSGVMDVAATVGAITQTDAAMGGAQPSVSAGLHDGFGVWWRTIGLLAIAALPTLLYLLVYALITFYTVSLPLYTGSLPNPAAMSSGNAILVPMSTLVTIAGIPLGVIVALGLRFVALRGLDWRSALAAGWRLARERFGNVALMYLIIMAVTTLATIAATVVIAVVLVVLVGMLGVVALIPMLALIAGTLLWQSVSWTVFWRRSLAAETAPQASLGNSASSAENPAVLMEGA